MDSKIKITDLKVSACHGVLDFEKTNPQLFVFNADIDLDFLQAAQSDDLNKTISYCDIMQDIVDYTKSHTFNLIEKLTYEIALMLINKYDSIKSITLTCDKPNAPYDLDFKSVSTTVSLSWHESFLSLGSNLGDRDKNLSQAVEKLNSNEIKVLKTSSILYNEPYGGVADKEFANMALQVKTVYSPVQLLNRIHEIEASLGRVRDIHWGNRTVDIDIIFYDNITMNTEDLCIPHKDYKNRDFVLIPLKEIAPYLF